jgi:hypothetical protein
VNAIDGVVELTAALAPAILHGGNLALRRGAGKQLVAVVAPLARQTGREHPRRVHVFKLCGVTAESINDLDIRAEGEPAGGPRGRAQQGEYE